MPTQQQARLVNTPTSQLLACDTFSRANGALGNTEITGPATQSLTALVWQFIVSIWTISTNKALATPSLGTDVIVNGTFAADANWTKGSGWTIAAGVGSFSGASGVAITEAVGVAGTWYQTTYTIVTLSSGQLGILCGINGLIYHNSTGTFTETQQSLGNTSLGLLSLGATTGSIDNVSFKPLILAELFSSVAVSTADVIASVAITMTAAVSGVQVGLVLNLDSTSSPANFIICYLAGTGNLVLAECVAGVYTNKFNVAVTYSAGAVLSIVRFGTSCLVFYNNIAVSTIQTMTANTSKNHGLFSTSANSSLDNFILRPWHA